ncbi:D-Ala-D-Ala carboxypeptidase family metallohydrolase [Arthrobacter sp. OVS8]|nr:D-Ala-D-Ala carboxypeptidase family metallohydrolase [Arthrobacter sp. OVS8]
MDEDGSAAEDRNAEDSAAEDQRGESDAGQLYFGESGFRFEDPSAFSETEGAESEHYAVEGAPAGEAFEDEDSEDFAPESGAAESGEWELAAAEAEAQDIGEHETFPSGQALSPTSGKTGQGEEHWDPNGTGLPLYETGPAVRGLKLSPNFTVGELVFSGGQYADKARISPLLVAALQKLRDRVGRPVRITSGYRSWDRNVAVYRRSNPRRSRLSAGTAADKQRTSRWPE